MITSQETNRVPPRLGCRDFGAVRRFGRTVWTVSDDAGNEFVCVICTATEALILERAGYARQPASPAEAFLPVMAFVTGKADELWARWHGRAGYHEHYC